MYPTFRDQLNKDHIAELRDDARIAHLGERSRSSSSTRQRLGVGLVRLGERLLSSSSISR